MNLFKSPLEPYLYDLEVYKNYFLAVFERIEDGERFIFETTDFIQHDLLQFIQDRRKILIGFNNLAYDDVILKAALHDKVKTTFEIFELSKLIIDENKKKANESKDQLISKLRWKLDRSWFRSVDLMVVMKKGPMFCSLKEYGARMKLMAIQDLPYSWDTELSAKAIIEVRDYCINDIETTRALYEVCTSKIQSRIDAKRNFGVEVLEKHEAGMGEWLMKSLFSKATRQPMSSLKYGTHREFLNINELISEWVQFRSPYLQSFLETLTSKKSRIEEMNKAIKATLSFAGTEYTFAAGGLHSVDRPGVFESDDEGDLIDIDVASFYPRLMITNNWYPEHLSEKFIDVLSDITTTRLKAKREKNTGIANCLKIVINAVYGKTKDKFSFLYDPKVTFSVTITGQLSLIMLIESLVDAGIPVVSANTDGIVVKCDQRQRAAFEQVCKDWERATSLELEATKYKKYSRRDVNNYVALTEDGKLKTKGVFDIALDKKSDIHIVRKAAIANLMYGTSVEDFIRSEKDIREFAYYFRTRRPFEVYWGDEKQQHTTRWYYSLSGRSLEKRDGDRIIKIPCGESVQIINKLETTEIPDDLDYDHYIKEVYRIVDSVAVNSVRLNPEELHCLKMAVGRNLLPKSVLADQFGVSTAYIDTVRSLLETEKELLGEESLTGSIRKRKKRTKLKGVEHVV